MKGRRFDTLAAVMLVVLLLAALHMISAAVQRSEDLGQWFMPLLLFSVVGLVLLFVLVGWNLWQLLRDYRRRVAGSRLSARLSVMFLVLALLPVSVVYFYSMRFLSSGIDSWFDLQVDSAMEDALTLSKLSLDLHKRERLKLTENLLATIEDTSQTAIALNISSLRISSGAVEMALFSVQGKLLALSHVNPEVLLPTPPDSGMVQQAVGGQDYVGVASGSDGRLLVRCLVRDRRERGIVLQALYPVPESLSDLSGNVQKAYETYRTRAYMRSQIKFTFALSLSMVLLLGLFAAAWGAVFTARRLVQPISDIAEGTRAVAEGDYDKQLPLPRVEDELGFLVSSFNAMTRRIARARDALEKSRRELLTQHNYLETVLGGLSTGVMAVDAEGRVQTANRAADQILGLDVSGLESQPLQALGERNEALKPFVERVLEGLAKGVREGRAEITLYRGGGRQVLLCRHSPLEVGAGAAPGHVLVFDDVTELLKAQRDAAWGEVARRLAHEIKNPLTPIQLSAERLRHKYLGKLPADDARVLDRATHTIVQQVEAMKTMVNDFSDYAKPTRLNIEPLQIDRLLGEVLALYEGGTQHVTLTAGAPDLTIEADPVRLRQVMHNLIKNALEASGERGSVNVSSQVGEEEGSRFVEIAVSDNGPGFDPELIQQVFEPYVTSKTKGTGLGLAIVKRIVVEHGGLVLAENLAGGGGRVVMRLPARAAHVTGAGDDAQSANVGGGR
ncbi:MAG: HAMP domain-containing protein [Gammaproteobacteria bacterium]|nr:HAMP domain-containing protein [Gammaproteobacteria bacterium]